MLSWTLKEHQNLQTAKKAKRVFPWLQGLEESISGWWLTGIIYGFVLGCLLAFLIMAILPYIL
jgi:hypothetical protein